MSFLDMVPGAQEKMEALDAKLKNVQCKVEVENGLITAVFNGNGNLVDVKIKEELDFEDIEDLMCVLINKGIEKAKEIEAYEKDLMTKELLGGFGGL